MDTELAYLISEDEFEHAETPAELRTARQHRAEIEAEAGE